jgi:uncharacterized protein (TIGR02266 family)
VPGSDKPLTLRIRLKYPDIDTFIAKYATNISRGGMFIQSKAPPTVGSTIRFELLLHDGTQVMKGEGRVIWVKEYDAASPTSAHGMGLRFTRLNAEGHAVVERILALKASQKRRVEPEEEAPLPEAPAGADLAPPLEAPAAPGAPAQTTAPPVSAEPGVPPAEKLFPEAAEPVPPAEPVGLAAAPVHSPPPWPPRRPPTAAGAAVHASLPIATSAVVPRGVEEADRVLHEILSQSGITEEQVEQTRRRVSERALGVDEGLASVEALLAETSLSPIVLEEALEILGRIGEIEVDLAVREAVGPGHAPEGVSTPAVERATEVAPEAAASEAAAPDEDAPAAVQTVEPPPREEPPLSEPSLEAAPPGLDAFEAQDQRADVHEAAEAAEPAEPAEPEPRPERPEAGAAARVFAVGEVTEPEEATTIPSGAPGVDPLEAISDRLWREMLKEKATRGAPLGGEVTVRESIEEVLEEAAPEPEEEEDFLSGAHIERAPARGPIDLSSPFGSSLEDEDAPSTISLQPDVLTSTRTGEHDYRGEPIMPPHVEVEIEAEPSPRGAAAAPVQPLDLEEYGSLDLEEDLEEEEEPDAPSGEGDSTLVMKPVAFEEPPPETLPGDDLFPLEVREAAERPSPDVELTQPGQPPTVPGAEEGSDGESGDPLQGGTGTTRRKSSFFRRIFGKKEP